MSVYRKRGSVVRYEQGVVVQVEEAGEARELGAELIAEPLDAPESGQRWAANGEPESPLFSTAFDGEGAQARVRERSLAALEVATRHGVALERIVISEGVAEHEYGARRWREIQSRVHISITHGPNRALLDFAELDLEKVEEVAQALARCRGGVLGSPDCRPQTLRLAPNVAAALLPSLVGISELEQWPAEHDGYGEPVVHCQVAANAPAPNWYRPSYRMRPIRAWQNLRAMPFGSIDESAPLAIALLAPPSHGVLRVLCVEGQDVFAATVEVTSIRAAGVGGAWYPYAAGAFGAEMLL
jgi:hypothetical protein